MTTPNQSFTFNAYQSNLAGPLLAGLTTVALDFIPSGLGVPAYLVIDPDVPASREYIKVLSYTGNTIDSMTRNLEGSAGDVDHLVGAVIRAVYTMQALDDTFLDIEANTTALASHASDVDDPHAAAGYIKGVEADAAYLRLDGTSPMAGAIDMANFAINQLATPIVDDDAATKKYVDEQDALYLPLTGGLLSGLLQIGVGNTYGLEFLNDTGGFLRLGIDVLDVSGATAVLRFGGSATTVDRLSIQAAGPVEALVIDVNKVTVPLRLEVGDGVPGAVAYGFVDDPDTGVIRLGTNSFGMVTAGVTRLEFLSGGNIRSLSNILNESWFTLTTGVAVNCTVDSGGIIRRFTSALKYKSNVVELDATYADKTLRPVSFHHEGDDGDYIGFIADDVAVLDERAATFHDGEVENYDIRAVVAILAAKVNRLESV